MKSRKKPPVAKPRSSMFDCDARSRIERMQHIQRQLSDGRYPNSTGLGALFGVSAKTILRDVEFMRDRMNLPIAFDSVKNGYFFSEPISNIAGIEVTEGEVVAVLVARKALAQYRGTTFERPLRAALEKLVRGMRDVITINLPDLEAALSFRDAGAAEVDAEIFSVLSKGVLQSRVVTFEYHKLSAKQAEVRTVQPYHLCCSGHLWYCIAFDPARGAIRTFALTRLKAATLGEAKFVRPLDFSIHEHLAGSFGIFCGDSGREFKVRIGFDEFATRLVGERKWHESQRIRANADGTSELSVTLRSIEEIERWVLSWGGHATVLAPKELRERVARAAGAIQGNNSGGSGG